MFILRQEILHRHFLRHKILLTYFGVCSFFAIKNKCTNICDTNICTQKILMQKNDVAKINPQKFLGIYFCNNSFCVKSFCTKKFLCNKFLFSSIYFCNGLFCGIYFCIFNYNDCLIKYAKKRCANYGVINIQKILHIYFWTSFFVYLFLYT